MMRRSVESNGKYRLKPALNAERTMTGMPGRWLCVVLAALTITLLGACERDDQCRGGNFRCDGDVAMNCVNYAAKHDEYFVWHSTPCGAGKCQLDGATSGAFCALEAAPEPRCDRQRWGFCDGTTLVSCRAGYVVASRDCATSGAEPKVCVPLTRHEVGDEQPLNAMCASQPEPSSTCGDNGSSDSCDGSEIVLCQHGYEVGRIPCAEGSSCDRSGICSKDSALLTLAP